jgi:hypothetical protein
MAKYTVMGMVDATVYEDVEADSPEEAREQAQLGSSICYQCSKEIEVGDIYDTKVLDESGEVVIESDEEVRRERMMKALKSILKAASDRDLKWLQKMAKEGLK